MGQTGGKYEGETDEKGQPKGQGSMVFPDGTRYDGEFDKGRYSGQGKLRSSDGDEYEGEFVDGQGHGKGKYTHAESGHVYEGEFRSGRRWGIGTLTNKEGDVLEGEWYSDLMNGEGTATYKSGGFYSGQWRNGEKSGRGYLQFPDGERYEGDWSRNERDGLGVLRHADGSLYEGEWSGGKRKGLGVFWTATGNCYEGEWFDDQPNGYGIEVYGTDKGRYEGFFVNGQRERYGVFYKPDETYTSGEWMDHGQLVGDVPSKSDQEKGLKAGKRAGNMARKARDNVAPAARGASSKTIKPMVYWHATNNFFAIVCGNGGPALPDSLRQDAKRVMFSMVDLGCYQQSNVILVEDTTTESIKKAIEQVEKEMQNNMTARRRESVPILTFFFAGTGYNDGTDDHLVMAEDPDNLKAKATLSLTELNELTEKLPVQKRFFVFDVARKASNQSDSPKSFTFQTLLPKTPRQIEEQDQETYILSSCAPGETSHARAREGSTFAKYFCAAIGGRLAKAYHACCGGQSQCVECRKFIGSIKIGDGTVYSANAFSYIATHVVQEHMDQHVTCYSNIGQGGFSPYAPFALSRPVKPSEPDFTAALKASE